MTGVSRSMLAQIEKGEVNPTISVLWKIANGYKVSFTSLLENRGGEVAVIRQDEIRPLSEDGGRYLNYPIFAFDEKKQFEIYRIVIEENGFLAAAPTFLAPKNTLPFSPARQKSPFPIRPSASQKAIPSAFMPTRPIPTKIQAPVRPN